MKKFLATLIAAALFISLSSVSFAEKVSPAAAKAVQSKAETLLGKIIDIDPAKNEITIQEYNGQVDSFKVNPNRISSLRTNEWIKVTL